MIDMRDTAKDLRFVRTMSGHPAVPVWHADKAVVDSWKLAHHVTDPMYLHALRGIAPIERPTAKTRMSCLFDGTAIRSRKTRWRIELHDIDMDAMVIFPAIRDMEDETLWTSPPRNRVFMVTAHDANKAATLGLPCIKRQACLCTRPARRKRHDRHNHVALRHRKVVDHTRVGRIEAAQIAHRAIDIEATDTDLRAVPLRSALTEEKQFTRARIVLGVSSKGALQDTAEIHCAQCIERESIKLNGQVRFFERKQAPRVHEHIGVRYAIVIRNAVRHAVIERACGRGETFAFREPSLRTHPPIRICDAGLREVEAMHHAVPKKPVLPGIHTQRVWSIAHQHAA